MIAFRPRRVEPDSHRRWLRQALQLSGRRPGLWAAYALLTAGAVHAASHAAVPLAAALYVLIHLAGISIAEAVDRGDLRLAVQRLHETLQARLTLALVIGAIGAICLLMSQIFLRAINSIAVLASSPATQSPPLDDGVLAPLVQWAEPVGSVMLFGVACTWLGWLIYPLVAQMPMSGRRALSLAIMGGQLNERVIGRVWNGKLLVGLVLLMAAPYLLIPLIPLCCALQYVAYRDIYLATAENERQVAGAPALAPGRA
jgi:hypothetical protein